MSISVACDSCGKRLNVRDELIGKKVKCPSCKTVFAVPGVGGGGAAIRVRKQVKEKGAKVSISWGFVLMIAGAVLAVGIVVAIVFGPVRAKHEWDPMAEKAESDVRDVVERGLQDLSQGRSLLLAVQPAHGARAGCPGAMSVRVGEPCQDQPAQ